METNSGAFRKPARLLLALMIGMGVSGGVTGCFGGSAESLNVDEDAKTDTTTSTDTTTDTVTDSGTDTTTDSDTSETTSNTKLSLFIDSAQLETGPTGEVKIFAYARDADTNAVLEGEQILFKSNFGMLTAGQVATNSMGYAETTLKSPYEYNFDGDKVTITASDASCNLQASCSVSNEDLEVLGAALSVSTHSAQISLGEAATFTATLTDGSGSPIESQWVGLFATCDDTTEIDKAISDAQGKVELESAALTANGSYQFCVKAVRTNSTWMVTADSNSLPEVEVSSDMILAFTNLDDEGGYSNAISATAQPSAALPVILTLKNGSNSTDGETITVTSTLGQISTNGTTWTGAPSANVTVSNGSAEFYLHSATAGTANLTAEYNGQLSKSAEVLFYSNAPAEVVATAAPSTVSQGETTTIRAVVKDANGVLVKGATVTFTVGSDITAGKLKNYSVITDKNGEATTSYTAGNNTTGTSVPVTINTAVSYNNGTLTQTYTGQTSIVVEPVHTTIVIGTGNKIQEPNTTQFSKDFVVQLSDNGIPVANSEVELLLFPTAYLKGELVLVDSDGDGEPDQWAMPSDTLTCESEDTNKNGFADAIADGYANGDIWDDPNGDGELTPGTTGLTLSAGSLTTDENGFGFFTLTYPQNYAWWIDVEIEARSSKNGVQSSDVFSFTPGLISSQVLDVDSTPANHDSPFGVEVSASDLSGIGSAELIVNYSTSPARAICTLKYD